MDEPLGPVELLRRDRGGLDLAGRDRALGEIGVGDAALGDLVGVTESAPSFSPETEPSASFLDFTAPFLMLFVVTEFFGALVTAKAVPPTAAKSATMAMTLPKVSLPAIRLYI